MFGIGVPELILILVVGLVVFGPGKLPEVARSLGKGIREFRKATNALSQAINAPEQRPVRPQQQAPAAKPAAAPVQEYAAAAKGRDGCCSGSAVCRSGCGVSGADAGFRATADRRGAGAWRARRRGEKKLRESRPVRGWLSLCRP